VIGNRWQVLFHFEQDGFTDNVNDIVPPTLGLSGGNAY